LQAQLFIFNHAWPGNQKQLARRIEIFPDGGDVEHAEVLAAKQGKVNGTGQTKTYSIGKPYFGQHPFLRG
jgi:hypothetical protein